MGLLNMITNVDIFVLMVIIYNTELLEKRRKRVTKTRRQKKLMKISTTIFLFHSINYLHRTKISILRQKHLKVLKGRGLEKCGMHQMLKNYNSKKVKRRKKLKVILENTRFTNNTLRKRRRKIKEKKQEKKNHLFRAKGLHF